MSLRFRLNLMISLTMLLIVGTGTVFVVDNARRAVIEEMESSVNLVLQLVDANPARTTESEAALVNWLHELSTLDTTRHLHIQVEQAPEKFIRVAPINPPRPVSAAPGWFVWAVTPPLRIADKRVQRPDGGQIRVAIEANPSDEIEEAWSEAQGFLMLMVALALTISLLVHITLGRAFQRVNVILRGLEDIERGDYSQRLRPFALPEFDRISEAVNHMAETLQQARDENRSLSQRSLAIQEEERRHIARELHDELGQSISAIKLMAASLRHGAGVAQAADTIDAIVGICDRLFGVVRGMMRRLRPLILDELGLLASLEDMVETWSARNPDIRLRYECDPAVEGCAGSAGIHVFRIVQECLTNIVKHAEAGEVGVRLGLSADAERLLMEVTDDGVGFTPGRSEDGYGLHGLRERVTNLGGEFALVTAPGQGVRIDIALPRTGDRP